MSLEHILLYSGLGLLGLVLGSFYNVVIYRYPAGLSIIRPRSYCPRCRRTLRSADLIPIFSYLFLRGRCRYCREKIPFRYAAVELAGAAILIALFWRFGFSTGFFKYMPILSLLLIISVIDLDIQKIPNLFVALILGWALLWQLFSPALSWLDALLGLLVGGGATFLVAMISRGGMGGGDIKLLAALGFLAGWRDLLLLLFVAVLLGAIVGIAMIIIQKKNGKTALPFGPFIAAAYLIALFWGEQIWSFYFTTILP